MSEAKKILILPGDGIGPEVTQEAVRVIEWFNAKTSLQFELDHDLIGGCSYDEHGVPATDAVIDKALASDAVLLGAIDGPKWDDIPFELRPAQGLLRLRKDMGLFANLRPAMLFDTLLDASSLRPEVVKGLDIMIVRELIGGLYFGTPRGIDDLEDGQQKGYNTLVYTTSEIERVARVAFEMARKRDNRVVSVDKSNALEVMRLWRDVVSKVHAEEYPDVELDHMFVDNCCMQLVRAPKQFDVILTGNLFGDIVSDEASMLTGSIGMLPSAALGAKDANGKSLALYEPVHGSAPDITGQGIANPLATILSFVMALRYSFDLQTEADLVEAAINGVLAKGIRTPDLMEDGMTKVSTTEMGDAVLAELDTLSA